MQVQAPEEWIASGTGEGIESQLDLTSVLRILRRRKWLVAAILILGTGTGILAGEAIIPRYTAKALVVLEPGQANVVGIEAVVDGLVADATTVETQIEVIGSRRNLASVVQAMGLAADPEFAPPSSDGAGRWFIARQRLLAWLPPSWLVAVGVAEEAPTLPENSDAHSAPVGAPREIEQVLNRAQQQLKMMREGNSLVPVDVAEDAPTIPENSDAHPAPVGAPREIEQVLNRVEQQLKVTREGNSLVIGISFSATDPAKAATIANKVAEAYIEDQRDRKLSSTTKATEWLRQRSESLRDELERSENAVQRFRDENQLGVPSKTNFLDQQTTDLNRELIATESELEARQGRLAFIADLRRRGEPRDTLPEVLQSEVIIELRKQEADLLRQEADLATSLGERHPQMQLIRAEKARIEEKISQEVERIVANLENESQIMATRLARLRANFEALRDAGARSDVARVHLEELERQATAIRQLYESFLQRYKETREQQELVDSDARLISPASPPTGPSTPGLKTFASLGLGASGLLAVLLALVLERFQTGLRSEAEVRQALGLTRIGLMPQLKGLKRGDLPHRYLTAKPYSSFTEAMRSAFAALKLADREQPAKLVLVTSALPGEGKSTLALSLAVFAAQSGEHVLLVDLDLRRPSILRRLQWGGGRGVREYVAGDAGLADVIRFQPETGIDVLGGGKPTSNPTALLQSPQFEKLLLTLSRSYDRVIIDSAPLLGITDAQFLASMVDGVLFVVQWHRTARVFARNAVSLLRQAKATVLGVVITQANIKKHMRYQYGDVGTFYGKYQNYYIN